ncbi:unnamed protein product [Rhizophagus irregularis]|nr:unnamed protein product [Rhizophagus irregularis]
MAEFYSSLSKDLTMLLTDTSDYNMIITPLVQIGLEKKMGSFYLVNQILKAMFIYGGKINFTDKMSSSKIFDCLKAADELCLDEFLDYAQTCLLGRKDWLKENLFLLYRDTFPPSSLTKLQEYCINQIRKYPLKLFISPEFITLPKVCLEELVQDDLLEISELQLFEKLIEWGIANTEDLTQTNINKFSEKDCASLSLTLDKLLKHIRFYHMESNDFYLRVTPLKAVLGTNFYDEMEVYHNKSTTTSTNGTSIPKPKKFINLLPNRGAIISKIMNLQQGAIISSWIDRKDIGQTDNVYYTTENNPYNFKLLLRDGSTNNNNQRDEIQPENVITDKQGRIARIKKDEEKFALNLWRSTGPSFGKFDILMQTGGIRLKHNSYVPNVIPLQDGENYKIEEYEVFEVTQKVDDSGGEKDRETNDVVVEIHE